MLDRGEPRPHRLFPPLSVGTSTICFSDCALTGKKINWRTSTAGLSDAGTFQSMPCSLTILCRHHYLLRPATFHLENVSRLYGAISFKYQSNRLSLLQGIVKTDEMCRLTTRNELPVALSLLIIGNR